jgi:hypothetical protein
MLEIVVEEAQDLVTSILNNVEFINLNIHEYENKHKGTAMYDDMRKNLISILGQLDKIRPIMEEIVNGVFIHTPRDKLKLPQVEVKKDLPDTYKDENHIDNSF